MVLVYLRRQEVCFEVPRDDRPSLSLWEAGEAIDEMHQKDFRTEEQKEADKDCPDGVKT